MGRPSRSPRRFVVLLAWLVCAGAVLTASPAGAGARATVRVLQLNLCDSGLASCYTGRAVARAAAVIRAAAPDLVTLSEICQSDVDMLAGALEPGGAVASAFAAAADRRTGDAFRCRDGQPYGIGLLIRIPTPESGYATYRGIYPIQDLGDPEERAWLCVDVPARLWACTTHLASADANVALAQCRYLSGTAIPMLHAGTPAPTVVSGDLNLREDGVRSCLPPGYLHAGDGELQHVMASGLTLSSTATVDMRATTDHAGLLVTLARPAAP